MRPLLVALILALLPGQAAAAGHSPEWRFWFAWNMASVYCWGDMPFVHDGAVRWMGTRRGGGALDARARQLSRECAEFTSAEIPPLPPPSTPTERKLVKAFGDLRAFGIGYAYWVVGDVESGGYDWYVANTWRGYKPIETRLDYYTKILTGGR